ncbi:MAG: phospholipid carrier-dependent glycosyltransferase [Armatimonadetes bacterium]|nr:phospholipid carrier-dependent glycosyltransferase [Armatimonadota bacterium]
MIPVFAVNKMPGLEPGVFALPLLVIFLVAGTFLLFFARFPSAVAPIETDTVPANANDDKSDSVWHYDRVVPAIIAVLFYMTALWRLSEPNKQVFDEVHHVRTAMEFVVGTDAHEWTHPHVSKLIQAASMNAAGVRFDPSDKTWSPDAEFTRRASLAWRLPSVVFGTLALLGQYALARAMFKNRRVATLAMILLALDGVFFVQSRIAMTNIFTVCFIVWGAWAAWRWTEEQKARHLFATDIFLGLAIGSRWSSLYAYVLIILFLLWDGVGRWQRTGWSLGFFGGRAALFIGFLVLAPLLVYASSYIPFVLQGSGSAEQKLLEWNHNGHGWGKVLTQQGDMYNYHSQLVADHHYDSPAWSWPLMLRPVWYYFNSVGSQGHETVRGIWCIGNAFVWWAILPTMAVAAWQAVRMRRTNLGFLALMGLGQWFCWLAKARGLNFLHYLFEIIPFVCIGLAYFLITLWNGVGKEKYGTNKPFVAYYRIGVAAYAGLMVGWFIFYYPLLSAFPIPGWYSGWHFWLKLIWI